MAKITWDTVNGISCNTEDLNAIGDVLYRHAVYYTAGRNYSVYVVTYDPTFVIRNHKIVSAVITTATYREFIAHYNVGGIRIHADYVDQDSVQNAAYKSGKVHISANTWLVILRKNRKFAGERVTIFGQLDATVWEDVSYGQLMLSL